MAESKTARRRRAPAMTPEERTGTILEAAREVFLERGFAAARVEDVAARAGVAKGTIYLHFDSKEALFKALVASLAEAPLGRLEALLSGAGAGAGGGEPVPGAAGPSTASPSTGGPSTGGPSTGGPSTAELLRRALQVIRREILGSERRFVLRLLLTEGHRFPEVARFHHDVVVARAMRLLRALVQRGIARGELSRDALARFPQLFVAPMLLAIVWEGLFGELDPLDVDGLLEAHLELMLHGMEAKP